MAKDKYYGKTLRKNFARHEEVMAMPNLLEIQKKSYKWFLDTGLREVFADVASITDYAGNLELSFIDYSMDEKPKYDVEECKARDATYAAPMKVRVRLHNKETGEIKEQEIFMGDFPLMTHGGTFVINGAERVVVSQIVRSPGVYYGKEIDLKTDLPLLTSTVIPYRGAWLEYETDTSEVFWVRIDKNRKLPITSLIRALGLKTDAEILEHFGDDERIVMTLEKDTCKTREESLLEIYRRLRTLPGRRALAVGALVLCMLSAVLTIGRESIAGYCLYGDSQLKAAEYIYENTEPEDTVLTDMRHNNEIAALTGRNIVCGSTSYVYFHGLDYTERETDMQSMFSAPQANCALFEKYSIDYILVSAYERNNFTVNETEIKALFPCVFDENGVQIYKVKF